MLPLLALTLLAAPAAQISACTPAQLSIAVDDEGGAFDGMSHSGTLLVLRNLGPGACSLSALPRVSFRDAKGRVLPIARTAPAGMHPGPVMVPVGVAADAEATTPLRWVAGPVFDRSRCFAPAAIAVELGGAMLRAPLSARICGQAGKPAGFEQPPLRTDPVLGRP